MFIDIHDSFELDAAALASHDLYFKRSYRPEVPDASSQARVGMLGLVNNVCLDGFDVEEARRLLARTRTLAQRVDALLRYAAATAAASLGIGGRPTRSLMHGEPTHTADPQVLFMAGLWDPAMVPDAAPDKIAEFEAVNEMRVACIRALRREFGRRFHGARVRR